MITDEDRKELDGMPDVVFQQWLRDVLSDDVGMSKSTFALGMRFPKMETMELWGYVVPRFEARLKWIVANRNCG